MLPIHAIGELFVALSLSLRKPLKNTWSVSEDIVPVLHEDTCYKLEPLLHIGGRIEFEYLRNLKIPFITS